MAAYDPVDRFKAECFLFELALKNQTPLADAERLDLRSRLHQLIFAMDFHTPIVEHPDPREKAG